MLSEQGVEYGFGSPKTRLLQLFDCLTEINQAELCGKIEQSKCASHAKIFFPGYANAIPLIHQEKVGVEGFSEGNGGGFSFIQPQHLRQAGSVVNRFVNFKPCGRRCDPVADRQRRSHIGKFGVNSGRKRNSLKHAGQKIALADLDQIIDWAGIGNHQPHGLQI